ncbi:RHS repeat protein [Rufibacter quisquiliarum]|uniref:YD repeat-containing protein n=1 Tax=Rufibacter quisquiliarum TaxID=1549639 RepID=A0A839GQF3_9BACT|nr:RHS repeat domain-containing protein [Rufibacter quisquiliarum]MBA9077106.1 YD repeat-containing protein [Rufibacter quisquiliarum]
MIYLYPATKGSTQRQLAKVREAAKRHLKVILIIASPFLYSKALGQASVGGEGKSSGYGVIKTFVPSSPEMASFQRYGDVPVNYNTGVPEIKVPLGQMVVGSFTWPISLSYHSGGNKVEDFASVAGLGWTLNAGGFISAKIMGTPHTEKVERFLDLSITANPFTGPCTTKDQIYNNPQDAQTALYYIETGRLYRPDIYYINMPTQSARFLMNGTDGYTVPISDNRIWVEDPGTPDGASPTYYFVDTKGNRYTFGRREASMTGGMMGNPTYALTRIDTYDGGSLTFEYETVFYGYATQGIEFKQRVNAYDCTRCHLEGGQEFKTLMPGQASATEFFLKRIVASNGQQVSFEYGTRLDHPSNRRLSKVTFYEEVNGSLAEQYNMELLQDYFSGPNGANRRLKLYGLKKKSGSTNGELYSFEYDPLNLPDRLSTSIDISGFYNGATNSSLLPSRSERQPNLSFAKASILTKMIYPTGGSTSFAYELNTGGWSGLRVKEILESDFGGMNLKKRSYTYEGVTENSLLFESFSQFSFLGSMPSGYENSDIPRELLEVLTCTIFEEQSSPVVPLLSSWFDNSLSYFEVSEFYDSQEADGKGKAGKIVYKYDTNLERYGRTEFIRFPPLLTEKHVYKWENSAFDIVQSEESFYSLSRDYGNPGSNTEPFFQLPSNPREVRLFMKELEMVRPDIQNTVIGSQDQGFTFSLCYPSVLLQRDHRLDLVPIYLTKTVSRRYEGGDEVVVETNYGYDSLLLEPVRASRTGSDGVLELDSTLYTNSDVTLIGYSPGERAAVEGLRAANVIQPLWTRRLRDGTSIYERQVYYKAWTNPSQPGIPKFLPHREIVHPSGGADKREIQIVKYGPNWLPEEILEQGTRRVAYIWGYRGRLQIAEARNAPASQIFHANFEEGAGWQGTVQYDTDRAHTGRTSGRIVNQSLTDKLTAHPTDQSTGSYRWLDISLSLPKEFTYSVWVYSDGPEAELSLFMRDATGRDMGVEFTHVATVSTTDRGQWTLLEGRATVPADVVQLGLRLGNKREANGGNNVWFDDVRLHPSEAQMTTYTHDPGKGMTSSTDPNGMPSFYEYDAFGRLSIMRDAEGNITHKYDYHLRER